VQVMVPMALSSVTDFLLVYCRRIKHIYLLRRSLDAHACVCDDVDSAVSVVDAREEEGKGAG
jgi:hypothetical protein